MLKEEHKGRLDLRVRKVEVQYGSVTARCALEIKSRITRIPKAASAAYSRLNWEEGAQESWLIQNHKLEDIAHERRSIGWADALLARVQKPELLLGRMRTIRAMAG